MFIEGINISNDKLLSYLEENSLNSTDIYNPQSNFNKKAIFIIMIGFGKRFMKNIPKEINGVFGYQTSMSMKSKDTWEFVH